MSTKIITADDSKMVRTVIKNALKPLECEVLDAENGVEACDLVAKHKPSLLLLDVTMPDMNGFEVLERLRSDSEFKNLPVLMLTAESGDTSVERAHKLGVNGFVAKPFKPDQLLDKVKSLLSAA